MRNVIVLILLIIAGSISYYISEKENEKIISNANDIITKVDEIKKKSGVYPVDIRNMGLDHTMLSNLGNDGIRLINYENKGTYFVIFFKKQSPFYWKTDLYYSFFSTERIWRLSDMTDQGDYNENK